MILVTGAGGKTGKALIRKLAVRGTKVRAWVHGAHQVNEVKRVGAVEVITGDLHDPELMELGCKNIEAIYHICPNMSPDEVVIGINILQAARHSGVRHFVYHSVLHPQVQAMPHHWNKLLVEEEIFSSRINFTILQPTAYLQNLLPYWPRIISDGVYEVPYAAETRLSMVDLEDVADAAAVVVNNPNFYGGIFELVGTPPYSQTEIAQTIEAHIHKEVRLSQETLSAWEKNAYQRGMNDYAVQTLLRMFEYYEKFGMRGNPHVLKSIINRAPIDLPEFIDRLIYTKS